MVEGTFCFPRTNTQTHIHEYSFDQGVCGHAGTADIMMADSALCFSTYTHRRHWRCTAQWRDPGTVSLYRL